MRKPLRLGDAITIKHGFAFPGDSFSEDPSFPILLTPKNFAVGGGFKKAKTKSFSGEIPADYRLEAGALVITMTDLSKGGDTLGLPAIVPDDGTTYLHNQRIGLVEINDPRAVDKLFLNYYLRTESYRAGILGTASGSTVRHTSPSRIENHIAVTPSVDEQHAIAEVLGALDDKIAANDEIAKTTDELVSARYFKLRSGANQGPLSDIASLNSSLVRPASKGSLRYVDIASVSVGTYEFPDLISWDAAPGRARRPLRFGDTIWSTVRPSRRSHALILDNDNQLIGSTGLAVLTPNPGRTAGLFESTRTPEFTAYLESVAEGSAYPAVRADKFLSAPVPVLSAVEWDKFENVALPLRKRGHAAVKENRSLAATREKLIPLLMSGKVRVRDAEKVVEEVV